MGPPDTPRVDSLAAYDEAIALDIDNCVLTVHSQFDSVEHVVADVSSEVGGAMVVAVRVVCDVVHLGAVVVDVAVVYGAVVDGGGYDVVVAVVVERVAFWDRRNPLRNMILRWPYVYVL